MAIDRCANLCCTVLVGIYLRNVDEWNSSLHRSRILIRVSARDNRAFHLPSPASAVCYSFGVKIVSALTSSCAGGAL